MENRFLTPDDTVLITNEFLARGQAPLGRPDIVKQAGGGIVIKKGFQDGGALLRRKEFHLESPAIVDKTDHETLFLMHNYALKIQKKRGFEIYRGAITKSFDGWAVYFWPPVFYICYIDYLNF